MMERDNRKEGQIFYLIDWCQQDHFWKSNILSPFKLRKHFDQLVLKIQSENQVREKESKQQFSLERPAHWAEPQSLTREEVNNLRKLEAELPF
jgi:hypothetical protein